MGGGAGPAFGPRAKAEVGERAEGAYTTPGEEEKAPQLGLHLRWRGRWGRQGHCASTAGEGERAGPRLPGLHLPRNQR